jgi:hypothetical protein
LRYTTVLTFAAALSAAAMLQAQTNPLISEEKAAYNNIKNNLLKAADAMPEDGYNFQATKDVRTFGALIAHISGQARTCGAVKGGDQKPLDTNKTAKADLVAVLKASFDACDAAWDSITDANATEMVPAGKGQRSKLGMLIGTTVVHNNEEYGYLAVYMRLKGVVPPSSAPRN